MMDAGDSSSHSQEDQLAGGEADERLGHCGYNVSETYPVSQVILRVYCILPAILLGLVGNVVNIVIFAQRAMRASPTNWFLLTLAVSDSVLLMSTFNMLTFPVMAERANILSGHVAAQYLTRIFYPLSQLAQTTSVYMVVAVTAHRFLGICHPFIAQRYSTRHNVKLVIFLTLLFAFIFTFPRWIHLSLVSCYSRSFDALSVVITTGPFYNIGLYSWSYNIIGYVIVMFLIPFCSLVVLDILLIAAVQRSSDLQRRTTRTTMLRRKQRSSPEDRSRGLLLCPPTSSLSVAPKRSGSGQSLNVENGAIHKQSSSPTTINKLPAATKRNLTIRRSHSGTSRTTVKGGRDNTTNSAKETSITLMLITIVTLFLLTNVLPFINNILEHFIFVYDSIQQSSFGKTFRILVETGNLLVTVNSSAYVLIYYFFNKKYRQIFAKTCCRGGTLARSSAVKGRNPMKNRWMRGSNTMMAARYISNTPSSVSMMSQNNDNNARFSSSSVTSPVTAHDNKHLTGSDIYCQAKLCIANGVKTTL